jgi:hypothetical protein
MITELDTYGLSYDKLTKEQKEFFIEHIWNGVGSSHFFINPHDLIFKEASIHHDFYYWRGGPDRLRKLADKDFFHRCHDKIRQLPKKRRPFYYASAYAYYFTLKLLGKAAWEKGEVCQTWNELLHRFNTKR